MADDLDGSSVLIVDDSSEHLRLLCAVLKRGGLVPRPVKSGRLAIEAAIAVPPDLVLLDVSMPEMSGLDVCRHFKQDPRLRDIPIIFVSSLQGVDDKVEALRAGGVDYVCKPLQEQEALERIKTHLRLRRLQVGLMIKQQVALQESEEKFRRLFDSSRDALMTLEPPTWRFADANPATLAMFKAKSVADFTAFVPYDLSPEKQPDGRASRDAALEMIGRAIREGSAYFEWTHRRIDGEEFPATVLLTRMERAGAPFFQATVRDMSEQRQFEIELGHARKLEAVGQLAAGIAHEINTPTQFVGDGVHFLKEAFEGYRRLLAQCRRAVEVLAKTGGQEALVSQIRQTEEDIDLAYLEENVSGSFASCQDGISRITTIARAMKEFAHPDQKEMTPANLNQGLQTTLNIAKNEYKYVADIETEFGDLPAVTCHVGALNQVFLNLIVNAAHAIGDAVGQSGNKGTIHIKTLQEGDIVRIDIADTGSGVPEAIRHRIFDPFFTTKGVGKGSGQGLAIARSIIVNKHHGSLTFESEVGKGTTFTIRLPIDGAKSNNNGTSSG